MVAALILLVAALADAPVPASAAQSTSSTKTAETAFNACSLLTRQEAATAVGEAVGEPKPKNPPPDRTGVTVAFCEFESAARNSLAVTVWRPSADSAGMFLQIYKSECLKKEQVPGLGDLACWYSKDHKELQLVKGSMVLTFKINRSGNATEALTTVAKNALGRLK